MRFILDSSVSTLWLLKNGEKDDQAYAERVLSSFAANEAWVPSLWWTEMADVVRRAEQAKVLLPAEADQFFRLLTPLPISERFVPGLELQKAAVGLTRQYTLDASRAAYLALSIQDALPLATVDYQLRKFALTVGVHIHLI